MSERMHRLGKKERLVAVLAVSSVRVQIGGDILETDESGHRPLKSSISCTTLAYRHRLPLHFTRRLRRVLLKYSPLPLASRVIFLPSRPLHRPLH